MCQECKLEHGAYILEASVSSSVNDNITRALISECNSVKEDTDPSTVSVLHEAHVRASQTILSVSVLYTEWARYREVSVSLNKQSVNLLDSERQEESWGGPCKGPRLYPRGLVSCSTQVLSTLMPEPTAREEALGPESSQPAALEPAQHYLGQTSEHICSVSRTVQKPTLGKTLP